MVGPWFDRRVRLGLAADRLMFYEMGMILFSRHRLCHAALLLLGIGLSPMATAKPVSQQLAEKRVWHGINGSTFEGQFVTIDQRTGKFVFSNNHGKSFLIASSNLAEDDREWIEGLLKARDAEKAQMKQLEAATPLARPVAPLVFHDDGRCEREWTNGQGRTIRGAIVSADRDMVKIETNGRVASVQLASLAEGDQLVALLWTGTTNQPLDWQGGVFHYEVTSGGSVLVEYTLEILNQHSRITMAYDYSSIGINTKTREKVPISGRRQTRMTTDHRTGPFQIEQHLAKKGWTKTSIGKWASKHHQGVKKVTPDLQSFIERLPAAKVGSAGQWLARQIDVEEERLNWYGPKQVAFVKLPGSCLAAALRLMTGVNGLIRVEPSDPALVAPKPVTAYVFTCDDVRFTEGTDRVLAGLQMHEAVPVGFSVELPSNKPVSGKANAVISLKSVDLSLPDASMFQIDPEAATMEEGTYRSLTMRRKAGPAPQR